MNKLARIIHRAISAQRVGNVYLLANLGPPRNDAQVNIFVHWLSEQFPEIAWGAQQEVSSERRCGYSSRYQVVVSDARTEVSLTVDSSRVTVETLPSELELLAGMRVLVGCTNGEQVEVIRDWLVWHVDRHGAEAALIVDRSDNVSVFCGALDALISAEPRLEPLRRILVVSFDHPLGIATEGAEGHPYHFPDAPGRARMKPPEPDPWRSRLGFDLLFDYLRFQFLAEAKSVLHLDPIELAVPCPNGIGLFRHTEATLEGVVLIESKRTFPWSVREGGAMHADHVGIRFDHLGLSHSWCLMPKRIRPDSVWMSHRILGHKSNNSNWMAWRCMAIRMLGRAVSKIVPKSSVIEDPRLLEIAAYFNEQPVRIPAVPRKGDGILPTRDVCGHRTAIVTTMKNEGPFILEWLAYHRAIGIADFLVYTNDCDDGTDRFLQLLERKGLLKWRENPYREMELKPQHAALFAAANEVTVNSADWLICMDVDEFIAVHVGDGTLGALYDQVPDATLISLTWRLFGSSDIREFQDQFVTEQFQWAARVPSFKPHQAMGFKTLFKNCGQFRKLGVHRPNGIQPQALSNIRWVNGSGHPLPEDQWRTAWRSCKSTYGYGLATLNHYAVRSAESFLVKRDRGRVNHVERDQGLAYWFRMNHNVVEDRGMERMRAKLMHEYTCLLADPEILQAHQACVRAHRAKISELRKRADYSAFYDELTSSRFETLSRLHGHFGSAVYIAGPSVIPDTILEHTADDDFFFTVVYDGETQH